MNEIPLSEFGLLSVADACDEYGWSPKTVQNWVRAGLLPALVVGSGRSARFFLRASDLAAFTPPPRGRPKAAAEPPESPKPPRLRGARLRNPTTQGRRKRS